MRIILHAIPFLLAAASLHADDEFPGPMAGWANLKSDYGAAGDGKADDTDALQRALDAMRPEDSRVKVLYFPAGTYRITRTLKVLREKHRESTGIALAGEDPATSAILWGGPQDGTMLQWGAWYSSIRRLSWDGAGTAKVALYFGDKFSTANEVSDAVIRDVGIGIQAGRNESAGQAECAVLRCQFLRCSQAGFLTQNWNSLDWWFWQCLFEDCRRGATNDPGCGNFHVYESVFRRSKDADVFIGNLGYFSFVRNTSTGSAMFFSTGWGHTQGAQVTMQGNIVTDPKPAGDKGAVVWMGNPGAWVLIDNSIGGGPKPPVQMGAAGGDGEFIAVGNTFTVKEAIRVVSPKVRFLNVEAKAIAPAVKPPSGPPVAPPRTARKIFEIAPGAGSTAVQQSIDEAARLAGQRPVIHLQAGSYRLDRTLVIPAGCDLQLVGDGMHNATTLHAAGADPLIRVLGPSHVSLRDMDLNGGGSPKAPQGVVIENCDQTGGRVHMDQAVTNGHGYGLVIEGLDRTLVTLHNHGHNGIKVTGGPHATGQVNLFQGASSRGQGDPTVRLYQVERGGKLLVRDIWYEGDPEHFLQLTDAGEFHYIGGHVATSKAKGHQGSEGSVAPVEINGFRGRVFLSQISANNAHLRIRGENKDLRALLLGWTPYPGTGFNVEPGQGQVGVVGCRQNTKEAPGSVPIPEQGRADAAFILEMLEPLRLRLPAPLPTPKAGVTTLTLHRVMVSGREGILLRR